MEGHCVSKTEFKARALEFFRQIEATGESLIVTDHGKPALEIRPYRPLERDPVEVLRGSVVKFDNPTEPVGEDDWEAAR
ncbi:type II toxin-antitoxin system Phd/YefM family antitoxin [Bordetella flabilis]|uniref:Prevent-host-death protein n=1 Tax=Bordetella flabilis TaxID=463014 RepID=A0A193GHI1_9BORD|nr:type II toxin-antitoxin system Phd/YefM family antitoxin [Bordetella flabilis]ANN78891.1 prevent-host-death protein [Bordetella flabilis]